MLPYEELLKKYNIALQTIDSLRAENKKLKSKLGIVEATASPTTTNDRSAINKYSSVDTKIRLFRKLFPDGKTFSHGDGTVKRPEKVAISLFVKTNGLKESAIKRHIIARHVLTENYCRYPTEQFIIILPAKTNTAETLSAFIPCFLMIPAGFCALILMMLNLKKM